MLASVVRSLEANPNDPGRIVTPGPSSFGRLLVVDDNRVNRLVLQRALESLGHETVPAVDGEMALTLLGRHDFDAVLLDVEMPVLDGYETLQRIKAEPSLTHLPVIMVSGVDAIDSVVRCIELGAVDYLQKPFNPALLRARIDSALAAKRTRDTELDIFDQVDRLVEAARAIERSEFDSSMLDALAERSDPIGALGRVFLEMAERVVAHEQRLTRQIDQLRRDAALARRSAGSSAIERLASYVAIDRRVALALDREIPTAATGAVLLADVSGFTAAVIARSQQLGGGRGAEELLSDLNQFYDRCVAEIHRFGGAVVGFAGDGVVAWFGDRNGSLDAIAAATSAGLELQGVAEDDEAFAGLKIAVTAGDVRRLAVGDPDHQLLDVLWGPPVAEAAAVERTARPGEVLAGPSVMEKLTDRADIHTEATDGHRGVGVAAVDNSERYANPWHPVDPDRLGADVLRPWLIPAVFDDVLGGPPGFLAELRHVTALFVGIDGLPLEDSDVAVRLDQTVRWIQAVVTRHDGSLLQLTPTERGGYLYACFGAPRATPEDAQAALSCALELVEPPPELDLGPIRVGLARGPMRIGGYGGADHTTYGAIGEQTNLAARLMQVAGPQEILADETVVLASGRQADFEAADIGPLKGIQGDLEIFRLSPRTPASALDDLEPSLASIAKIASVFPGEFDAVTLAVVHTELSGTVDGAARLAAPLDALCDQGILAPVAGGYVFTDQRLRDQAHGRLLYTQRRTLHRHALYHLSAVGHSSTADPVSWLRSLAYHAEHAEDEIAAAAHYEQAAQLAQADDRTGEALELLKASLRFEVGDTRTE